MHWPEPVKAPFAGRGKILTGGITLIAAVFGVLVAEWTGVAILGIGILLLLSIELWIESGRLTKARDAALQRIDEVTAELALKTREAEAAETRAGEVPALEGRVTSLTSQVESLREELASPRMSLEQLLESVGGQLGIIDLVQKHKHLEGREGLSEWPVVRAAAAGDNRIDLVALVGPQADQVAAEYVAVVHTETDTRVATGAVVSAETPNITAEVAVDELPPWFVEEVQEKGSFNPNGYALRLLGLALSPYAAMQVNDLDQLRGRLQQLADEISGALMPGRQLELGSSDE